MLRVRTTLSGWDGGPGLMTSYFLTPLQDLPAATRCVGYVQAYLVGSRVPRSPDNTLFTTQANVDVLNSATGAITSTLVTVPVAPNQGAGGVSRAPAAIAALLRLETSTYIAGRRVRGRSFVSPLADSAVSADGSLTPTAQSGLAGIYAELSAVMAAGDQWVVWHRPKLGVGGLAVPITGTTVPFKLAVLTSRRD